MLRLIASQMSMELGGNAPYIVFDDADIGLAVRGVVSSAFRNSGQTCICANRIFVQVRGERRASHPSHVQPITHQGPSQS